MPRTRYAFLLCAVAALTLAAATAQADLKLPRLSPNATISQTIGLTDLTLTYSRPGVKGRTIWGDLVPYDKPWRTGANEATTFKTTDDIEFGANKLPAGTYALLTIPGKDSWTIVLNSQSDLWGSVDYDEKKDVARLQVRPMEAPHQEWMSFAFENLTPSSADLVLRWEKVSVTIPIALDVDTKVMANIQKALEEAKPDEWRPSYQAANWAFSFDTHADEGRQWLDQSLAIQKTYQNLNLLARWQMKDGKKKEAIATAKLAIAAGKASKEKVDVAPTEKLVADWTAAK